MPLFTYQCTTGFCDYTYGTWIDGTSEDVAKACSNDYPKCKAYHYSTANGHGLLCESVESSGSYADIQNCVQIRGYDSKIVNVLYEISEN